MKFDSNQHIWVCAAEDEARPALTYCNVERTGEKAGTITAANGFIMAQIQCTLDPGEEVGLVHRSAFEQMLRQSKSKPWKNTYYNELYGEIRGNTIELLGMTLPRWHFGEDGTSIKYPTFPDVRAITNRNYLNLAKRISKPYAFYPKQAARLAEALGREWVSLWCAEGSNLYVDYSTFRPDGEPAAPFGAIMGAFTK